MADFSALKTAIQANIRTNANEEITGAILQEILLSIVTTMGDGAINGLVTALQEEVVARQNAVGGEATARGQADAALSGRIDGVAYSITAINTKLAEGYIYAGIATPSTNPGTPSGKVFYIALQGGTYTNFSGLTVIQGINILKYNGSAWSLEQIWGVDDVPNAGSNNLVKSGGAFGYEVNKLNKEVGKNLFNKNDASNLLHSAIFNDRTIHTNPDYPFIVTHFIPVKSGLNIYCNQAFETGVYNAEYNETFELINIWEGKSHTVSANAKYVRWTINGDYVLNCQCEYGTSATAYEDYTDTLIIDEKINNANQMLRMDIDVNYLSKSFGKNLFNKSDDSNIEHSYIGTDGNIVTNPDYPFIVTHFIPVEGGRNVYCNEAFTQNVYNAEYDEDFNLISTWIGQSHTLSASAKYVRWTINSERINQCQCEYGTSGTTYEDYTDIKTYEEKILEDIDKKKNKKKILWLGTSIPAGWGAYNVTIEGKTVANCYPNMVGILTNSIVINKAVGSQRLAAGFQSLISQDNPMGFTSGGTGEGNTRALMQTLSQKQDIIDNWSTYRTQFNWTDAPATLSDAAKWLILDCSFESCVVPYLDGTYDKPDIIVIDHGFNDSREAINLGDLYNDSNLFTFYGAYNYLVNLIHQYDRNIKIIQMSYFLSKPSNIIPLIDAQRAISGKNGIPFCPLYEYNGWDVNWTQEHQAQIKTKGRWNYSQVEPYASYQWAVWEDNVLPNPTNMYVVDYHCPDGIHPHSDMSGQQNRELAYAIAWWMKSLL